ncbi:hypothetical protein PM082_018714 [Marasmius tenuissimus]|nr:hypothetical protein PM082_018714 [Marasmius tenuissimus]
MILPGALGLRSTWWLILPGARCFSISVAGPFTPETTKPGRETQVNWGRDPTKDSPTFEFVWIATESGERERTNVGIDLTSTDIKKTGDTINVLYPKPGRYNLAIYSVPVNLADNPLFTGNQEIRVEDSPDDTTTSETSVTSTTISIIRLPQSSLAPSQTNTGTTSSGRGTTTNILSVPPTPSASNVTNMETSQSTLSSNARTTTSESATSREVSNTTLSATATTRNYPSNVSQTRNAPPVRVVPIVVGAISGLLMLGVIAFTLRCYLRKRRSASHSSFHIYPVSTQLSQSRDSLPESDSTTAQQGPHGPGVSRANIVAQGIDYDLDTKSDWPALVDPDCAEPEVTSLTPATTAPVVQRILVDPNAATAVAFRLGMGVFTTDELAVELNQRLREEGRWDNRESLPEYSSDSGYARLRS